MTRPIASSLLFNAAAGLYAGSLLFLSRRVAAASYLLAANIVKRVPGLVLILLANIALCLLMIWYFPRIRKFRTGGS